MTLNGHFALKFVSGLATDGLACPAYEVGNISETVEDRATAIINGLYKVVHALHGLSIATKMYDLE